MKSLRRFIRALMMALLLLVVVLPTGVYIILSTSWAQEKLRLAACTQLTALLGTKVEIGRVDYHPFNTLSVTDICVRDSSQHPALELGRLSARFELWHFLRTRRLVFDYILIDAMQASVNRQSPEAPLNIQPIIDRFRPGDPDKPPTQFDLKIGTIVIRSARLRYDIMSQPDSSSGFNPAHILVTDLNMHAYLRNARPDYVDAELESLSFKEKSGFEMSDLKADLLYSPEIIDLRSFILRMPNSEISLKPVRIQLDSCKSVIDNIKASELRLQPESTWRIATADLACFNQSLDRIDRVVSVDFDITASIGQIKLHRFDLSDSEGLRLNLNAIITRPDSIEAMHATARLNSLHITAHDGADIANRFNQKAAQYIGRTEGISARGTIDVSSRRALLNLGIGIGKGNIDIKGTATTADRYRTIDFECTTALTDISAGDIAAEPKLGSVSVTAHGKGHISNRGIEADGSADIISASWLGHSYTDIDIKGSYKPAETRLSVNSNDPDAAFSLVLNADPSTRDKTLDMDL
ncbi:MAG: hypothetical protein K2L77_06075, partial [Muribaculaceae bacterium]|nr:hypothetical protein [Muribaculaceae bacterium]